MSNSKKSHILNLALIAIFIAVQIILSRFLSIQMWNLKIGFSFIPIVIAARRMGPIPAMVVAAVSDFLGAILFPTGVYFPGFTLTAGLMGLCNGFFLHKNPSLKNICITVLINQIFGSLLLNTLWISLLYGSDFFVLLSTRVIQSLGMAVVQILVMRLLFTKCDYIINKKFS